jgi:tripartite-type tricarboxylate transporter receptor subunit TctC
VPYPPGGTTDVLARIIAQWLTEKMGQTFIIENKPGGGNNIGTEVAIKSAPGRLHDAAREPRARHQRHALPDLPFNVIRDVAPVAGIVKSPKRDGGDARLPGEDREGVHRLLQGQPGKDQLGLVGHRHSVHMSGEMFKMMTGCDMLHIPYKGAGPALIDLIVGQGRRPLRQPAVVDRPYQGRQAARDRGDDHVPGDRRCPDVPTVADTVPGYEATAWFGIGMPKGSPRDVDREGERRGEPRARRSRDARDARRAGRQAHPGTPEDFGSVMAEETARWEKVVKASGAKAE